MHENVKNVGISPGFWNDITGNYGSRTDLNDELILEQLAMCWHMRVDGFCEGYIRVPIPSTRGGKHVFFSNVLPAATMKRGSISISVEAVSAAEPYYMIPRYLGDVLEAKARFVDLILANREARVRDKLGGRRELEVVNFHAMPEKDIPPPPLTMARQLRGPNSIFYRYTTTDFMKSALFWSQHVMVTRL